jgi:hypothetical protein
MDGSTSRRFATDNHWLTNLYIDLCPLTHPRGFPATLLRRYIVWLCIFRRQCIFIVVSSLLCFYQCFLLLSLCLLIFYVSIGLFLLLTLCACASFGDGVYSLWLVIFCVSVGCFCVFSILCASIGYLFRTCVLGADHGSSRVTLLSSKYYFSPTTSSVVNKRTKSKVFSYFFFIARHC